MKYKVIKIVLCILAIAIVLTSWVFKPGVIFQRSLLLLVSAVILFIGITEHENKNLRKLCLIGGSLVTVMSLVMLIMACIG